MKKSLTKKERLSKKYDIESVFRRSRCIEREGLVIRYRENGMEYNRVMISLRRGFPGAVERNKAKRMLREIYRTHKHQLKQSYDFAFILSPGSYTYHDLEDKVLTLFAKNDLLTAEGSGNR